MRRYNAARESWGALKCDTDTHKRAKPDLPDPSRMLVERAFRARYWRRALEESRRTYCWCVGVFRRLMLENAAEPMAPKPFWSLRY